MTEAIIRHNQKIKRIVFSTNLETTTSAQKERLMKTLVETHKILFRSVLERYILSLTTPKLSSGNA